MRRIELANALLHAGAMAFGWAAGTFLAAGNHRLALVALACSAGSLAAKWHRTLS